MVQICMYEGELARARVREEGKKERQKKLEFTKSVHTHVPAYICYTYLLLLLLPLCTGQPHSRLP